MLRFQRSVQRSKNKIWIKLSEFFFSRPRAQRKFAVRKRATNEDEKVYKFEIVEKNLWCATFSTTNVVLQIHNGHSPFFRSFSAGQCRFYLVVPFSFSSVIQSLEYLFDLDDEVVSAIAKLAFKNSFQNLIKLFGKFNFSFFVELLSETTTSHLDQIGIIENRLSSLLHSPSSLVTEISRICLLVPCDFSHNYRHGFRREDR